VTGARTASPLVFVIGSAAVGVAYAATIIMGAAPPWAPWLVAVGGAAATVGLFVLGARTRGVGSRGVSITLAVLFVTIAAAFGIALALAPREVAGGPLLLGLPLRLAIVFYGVGLVPLFALPLVFAKTFRDDDA